MRRLVLDARLFLEWFAPEGAGRSMRREYEAGALAVAAPRSLPADVLGLLAGREGWPLERLPEVAAQLDRLAFELHEPTSGSLARWISRGLPPDRAAYPALAADLDLRIATADPELARVASSLATEP
jgi:predicted nucleic acid-binding protein